MRLFSRLFLSHLTVIVAAVAVLFVAVLLLSQGYYRTDVGEVMRVLGPVGLPLLADFERSHRQALLLAYLSSLPFATLLAAGIAYFESRRVAGAVRLLSEGSREVAAGRYSTRVALPGQDELSDLANNFNDMAAALSRLERERLELISTVAHELRTPLAALQGYTEALADGVMASEVAVRAIRREGGLLRRMAHDLLLIAKVEAGAAEVRPALEHPKGFIAEAYDRFSSAFEQQRVEFTVALPDELSTVWADRERVDQVLSNLLSNALRYTPEGGNVTLGAQADGGEVLIYVADDGPGIPLEHQARVFERFYRIDEARSRSKGGIGVGLAVTKGLVEAMGGRIWLSSQPGRGATFSFTLPVRRIEQETVAAKR